MRVVILLGLLLVTACAKPDPPNLLVIGIDTLRADHLGAYGYQRPTSPRIDALGREGVVFRTAISPSPWTLPGFSSIFTGLLPSHHRAGEGTGFERSRLDARYATLATHLKKAGYATASFVSNGFVGPDFGLNQGFDHAPASFWTAGDAAQAATIWLDDHAQERFFMFVHIVDPHAPYSPTAEDAAPFIDPSYTGQIGMVFADAPPPNLTDADRKRIIDLYDGEIHYADRLVGNLLDALAAHGVLDRTAILLTSDHGEELFERGAVGHGHSLYDELLRVPLIMRLPGESAHAPIDRQVSTVDVTPTLLDALGLDLPEGLDGVSLMPLVRGEKVDAAARPAFSEFLFSGNEQKSLRLPAEKLVYTPSTREKRLYDLVTDPGERTDVAASQAQTIAPLLAQIEQRLLSDVRGIHVFVRGGSASDVIEVQLRATRSPFAAVEVLDGEPNDRVSKSEDGKLVTLTFARDAQLARDIDGARLVLPEGEPVIVTARRNGKPLPQDRVVLGATFTHATRPAPWILDPKFGGLRTETPMLPGMPPDGEPIVALQIVAPQASAVGGVSDKTRDNLRALGYAE